MTNPARAGMRQNAVLWAVGTTYTEEGFHKVSSSSVQIKCRWEEKRGHVVDDVGVTVAYDAEVKVNRAISVGSILWLGKKRNWSATSGELFQVAVSNKVPSHNALHTERTLLLQRYGDTLPPTE